jgi:hypothetical protein
MVQITLNFKTIEAARQALLEIPASALVGGPEPEAVAAPAPAPKPARAAKTTVSTAVVEPVAAPAPVTAPPVEAPAPVAAPAPVLAPAPAEPATIDYAQLQRAVLSLYKVDKSRTQQIALDMGFESFKVMPADRWAEALAAVNAALGV